MSTEAQTKTAPAMPDLTSCPHWGVGGQYTLDPVTGLRTRLGEPLAAPGVPSIAPAPAPLQSAVAAAPDAGAVNAAVPSQSTVAAETDANAANAAPPVQEVVITASDAVASDIAAQPTTQVLASEALPVHRHKAVTTGAVHAKPSKEKTHD